MSEKLLASELDFYEPFPSQSRRLRLGVVGGGRISATQAMAARLSNRWEVVAGALSSDPEKAQSRALNWYIDPSRSYSNFETMAQEEAGREDGIDAVMITTPNHLHYPAAKAFLQAGINVLCDKPLTNELAEAQALINQHQQTDLVFAVCYVMSCFPMIRQARQLVHEGKIGKINQIHVEFMQDWMVPDDVGEASHVKWRLDPAKSGPTSCTGDIATHAAHLASFVSGLPMTHLQAHMHVCGAPKPLEDTVMMMTRYAGDVPGTLIATRLAPGNRGGLRLRIYGSEGGVEWCLEDAERLKFNRYGEADRIISRGHGHGVSPQVERLIRTARGFPEGLIEAWGNLYTEFALAVAARNDGLSVPENGLLLPSLSEGVQGVQFIDAAVQSHQAKGAWIALA